MIYGVILIVVGLGDSDAEIEKAADININLYAGLAMLVFGLLFVAWALMRPLSAELDEAARRGPGTTPVAPSGRAAPGGSRASTAPPKPPPIMRAPAAPARLSALDRRLDLGHRRLVVVAQAGVRGVEQPPDGLEVARAQRRDRLVDAAVLAQHVARAAPAGVGEPLDGVGIGGAEVLDAELAGGGLALGAALVVARGGDRVRGARVDGGELPALQVERDALDRERREVDPQRLALGAEQRGELVEQPGLGADPVVLDPRAQLRQLDPVGLLARRRRRAARGTARSPARPRTRGPSPAGRRRRS